MKNFFFLILVGFVSLLAFGCEKTNTPAPNINGEWRLDSISLLDGSGATDKFDYDNQAQRFPDVNLILEFKNDSKIEFTYGGRAPMGTGNFIIEGNGKLRIKNLVRGDESLIESQWFNVSVDALNKAETYQEKDGRMFIYYEDNTRKIHFTKP